MTISSVKLYRRGQWQSNEDGSESVVDVWEVISNSESETITAVLSASGLPARGDSHDEKASAIYNGDASADHDSEVLTRWLLSYKYSTKLITRESGEYSARRVKGGMKSGFKTVPAYFDSRGYPLVNTAGDLYEGLTRKQRLRIVPVTAFLDEWPDYLFELADTINASAVTILGKFYPPGTCLLTDVDCSDEPERDAEGNLYYAVTFRIEIDPSGYFVMLPNKGPNELVYQTRATTDDEFADSTKAAYDAESDADLKQKIKRPIVSEEQQSLFNEIWLDANGQGKRVLTLTDTVFGVGATTDGSTTLTLSSGTFVAADHKGAHVKVKGAGPFGRPLLARIDSVDSSTTATLSAKARKTVSGKDVYLSGALVNYFVMEDLADWSSVPLPNNHPGGA